MAALDCAQMSTRRTEAVVEAVAEAQAEGPPRASGLGAVAGATMDDDATSSSKLGAPPFLTRFLGRLSSVPVVEAEAAADVTVVTMPRYARTSSAVELRCVAPAAPCPATAHVAYETWVCAM